MSYRCGHCNSELTVHRNIVLHPTEDGCNARATIPHGVAHEPNIAYQLADAAEKVVRTSWHASDPDRVVSAATKWSIDGWKNVAGRHGIDPRRVNQGIVAAALKLLESRVPF